MFDFLYNFIKRSIDDMKEFLFSEKILYFVNVSLYIYILKLFISVTYICIYIVQSVMYKYKKNTGSQ